MKRELERQVELRYNLANRSTRKTMALAWVLRWVLEHPDQVEEVRIQAEGALEYDGSNPRYLDALKLTLKHTPA